MIEYDHHSPSGLNLFNASPAMFVLERVLKIPQTVGAPAHRGKAVEEGVTVGLCNPNASDAKCIDAALTKYDTEAAFSADPRREKYRDNVPGMVLAALEELRPYSVPDELQGKVSWQPPELKKPIIGFFDYRWGQHGILVDLKTTERMPSEIKASHARQVSLYAASDNIDARLAYVTPKKLMVYRLENIRQHRQALLEIAIRVEKFLSLSDDPEFFVGITTPDIDNFYWKQPACRQLAYEHWRI